VVVVCVAAVMVANARTTGSIIRAALASMNKKEREQAINETITAIETEPDVFLSCVSKFEHPDPKQDCHLLTPILKQVIIDMEKNDFVCTGCSKTEKEIVKSVWTPITENNKLCTGLLTDLVSAASATTHCPAKKA